MIRHDEGLLWQYAASELESDEARVLEDHLDDCPECREKLAAVQVAREALDAAREAEPALRWEAVDAVVGAEVERRLQRQARGFRAWKLALGAGALALAAGLVVVAVGSRLPGPPPAPAAQELAGLSPAAAEPVARVDRARGLERLGARPGPLADGEVLEQGAVLATSRTGQAVVHLPDLSHLRLGPSSRLALSRLAPGEVALSLELGRLAVRASHQERQGFVVRAGRLAVHVVGTVFALSQGPQGTEVAVAEGRVRVELPGGESVALGAGQRLRADARGRVQRQLPLTPAFGRELDEVGAFADDPPVPDAPGDGSPVGEPRLAPAAVGGALEPRLAPAAVGGALEPRAAPAAAGGALEPRLAPAAAGGALEPRLAPAAVRGPPSSPPLVAAPGRARGLPRLDPREARARQGTLPPEATAGPGAAPPDADEEAVVTRRLEPPTEVVVEEPGGAWPSMAGGSNPAPVATAPAPFRASAAPAALAPPTGSSRRTDGPGPSSSSAPVPAPPAAPEQEWAPLPQAPPVAWPLPQDLETRFMEHAQASLEKGECERYLPGLEDIAQDGVRTARTELARVLRARCFSQGLRPRQAMSEYRKYLEAYPGGRFAAEAQEALGR